MKMMTEERHMYYVKYIESSIHCRHLLTLAI